MARGVASHTDGLYSLADCEITFTRKLTHDRLRNIIRARIAVHTGGNIKAYARSKGYSHALLTNWLNGTQHAGPVPNRILAGEGLENVITCEIQRKSPTAGFRWHGMRYKP